MLLKTLLGVNSPAGRRARLSVLIFHRVLPAPDPLFPGEVDARGFDAMCAWVAAWFNVLPLHEAARRMREGTLPARAAAITFDDGYADNAEVAMPILQRHGLSATFFVATGFLDGGRMWNDTVIEAVRATALQEADLSALPHSTCGRLPLATLQQRRAAIAQVIGSIKYLPVAQRLAFTDAFAQLLKVTPPGDLMMTSEQVRALQRGGMQVGAHTVSHPILARLGDAQARDEIAASKRTLEGLLQQPVGLFAYPNGKPGEDYLPRDAQLARELGFEAAVSTAWGAGGQGTDPFQIPRFTPWDRQRWRFGLRMARNLQAARHGA
jgi:peptidoglycan/xylan/chitin deacetylase (PgdA/CDA1 family)